MSRQGFGEFSHLLGTGYWSDTTRQLLEHGRQWLGVWILLQCLWSAASRACRSYDESPFCPKATLQFMANHKINSVAAAPTVYRALRALPFEVVQQYSQDIHLQSACSAGEPLPPAVSQWFQEHFGVPILNHYGQTENGIMVNQHRAGPHKWQEEMDNRSITRSHHSTMGTPMEGFQGACLLDSDGQVITEEGTEGELCMKLDDCPLFWFSGYYQSDKSVIDKDGYYHTGDRARLAQTSTGETTFV